MAAGLGVFYVSRWSLARSPEMHRLSFSLLPSSIVHPFPPALGQKGHHMSRRSVAVLTAMGLMAGAARAEVEGTDTSRGGDAPGADLRCCPTCQFVGS